MADRSVLREDSKEGLYLTVRGGLGRVLAGYKRELVTQQLSEIERQLLVCHICNGFMRNACNTMSGTAMGCEACVGTSGGTVGTVRTMVSNLRCMCPLRHRGCEWEGSIGEVAQHLEECDCLVVVCPYSVYGCPKRVRRGDMGTHKGEGNEYHTELMSTFTKQKIDQLESAKMVQGEAIRDLQESIGFLRDSISTLRADGEYMRPNGLLWRIPYRDMIIMGIQALGHAGAGIPSRQYSDPATDTQWNGQNLIGPIFELDSYKLRPLLLIESADKISLQLLDVTSVNMQQHYNSGYGTKVKKKEQKWPLGGKCKIILVNPTNRKSDWQGEINTSQFIDSEQITLTRIPSRVLLAEEYNNNGNIEIQLLFKTPYKYK